MDCCLYLSVIVCLYEIYLHNVSTIINGVQIIKVIVYIMFLSSKDFDSVSHRMGSFPASKINL